MVNIVAASQILSKELLIILIVALLTVSCSRGEGTVRVHASAVSPECTITTREVGNDILVKVSVANHSQSPYRLLEWNLPKNGEMTTALFRLTRDGSAVEYKGRMVKRQVTEESYVTVHPGTSLSAEIPLLQGYEVRTGGRYEISYMAFNQGSDSSGVDTLDSNTVTAINECVASAPQEWQITDGERQALAAFLITRRDQLVNAHRP